MALDKDWKLLKRAAGMGQSDDGNGNRVPESSVGIDKLFCYIANGVAKPNSCYILLER